jgi:hypothetical protein
MGRHRALWRLSSSDQWRHKRQSQERGIATGIDPLARSDRGSRTCREAGSRHPRQLYHRKGSPEGTGGPAPGQTAPVGRLNQYREDVAQPLHKIGAEFPGCRLR